MPAGALVFWRLGGLVCLAESTHLATALDSIIWKAGLQSGILWLDVVLAGVSVFWSFDWVETILLKAYLGRKSVLASS